MPFGELGDVARAATVDAVDSLCASLQMLTVPTHGQTGAAAAATTVSGASVARRTRTPSWR
jgi:hypothetical protein